MLTQHSSPWSLPRERSWTLHPATCVPPISLHSWATHFYTVSWKTICCWSVLLELHPLIWELHPVNLRFLLNQFVCNTLYNPREETLNQCCGISLLQSSCNLPSNHKCTGSARCDCSEGSSNINHPQVILWYHTAGAGRHPASFEQQMKET